MNIELSSMNAYGTACHGMFLVVSPTPFTWEEGRVYAETHLDDEIVRYNLLLKAQAKKNGSGSGLHYQWTRDGPIKKLLKGPCMDPTAFPPNKWDANLWYCAYRYPAKQGSDENYLKTMARWMH